MAERTVLLDATRAVTEALYGLIPYLLLVGIPRLIGVVWTR